MALKLLRTIDPGSLDTDPLTNQPAADVFGELITTRGKLPRLIVWEVDTGGKHVTPTATGLSVAIVMLSRVPVPGEDRLQSFWSRGPISTGVLPGEEQVQSQARSVVEYTGIITAEAGTTGLLAIYGEVTP